MASRPASAPAVEQVQVQRVFEVGVHGGAGFAAVARGPGAELELGAGADLGDAPGQPVATNQRLEPLRQGGRTCMHGNEDLRAQEGAERGAHRSHCQEVADARVARRSGALGGLSLRCQFGTEAVCGTGHAAADGLAHHHRVGRDAVGSGIAAGAAAGCVGLVHHQQAAVATDQRGGLRPVARLGQHHADVRHHRSGGGCADPAQHEAVGIGGRPRPRARRPAPVPPAVQTACPSRASSARARRTSCSLWPVPRARSRRRITLSLQQGTHARSHRSMPARASPESWGGFMVSWSLVGCEGMAAR